MAVTRKWRRRNPTLPPANLEIAGGDGLTVLTWELPTLIPDTFRIELSTTSSVAGFSEVATTNGTTATRTLTGLANGTQVWVRVRALKGATYSSYTSAVTATPASGGGGTVNPGDMALNATFNSIGIEVPYSGNPTAATMRFRQTTPTVGSWRAGLPLKKISYTDDGVATSVFVGSALDLAPGRQYEVEVTVDALDPLNDTITLRADSEIPDWDALTPTRYVSPSGSASNTGLTVDSPWTLAKAMSTAADANDYLDTTLNATLYPLRRRMIVKLAAGEYPGDFTRTGAGPITLLGPASCVTYTPSTDYDPLTSTWAINGTAASDHAVLTPPAAQCWSAGGDAWELVTLTGPGYRGATPGATYQCYRWKGTNAGFKLMTVSPAADRYPDGITARHLDVPNAKGSASDSAGNAVFTTAQRWIEWLNTNLNWNVPESNAFGFFVVPASAAAATGGPGGTDDRGAVYVRLPNTSDETPAVGDAGDDPDTYYGQMAKANEAGLTLTSDSHVRGLHIRGHYRIINIPNGRSRTIVDQCVIYGGRYGQYETGVENVSPIPDVVGEHNVIQRCMAFQTSRGKRTTSDNRTTDWNIVKQPTYMADGSLLVGRLCQEFESTFTKGSGSGKLRVTRWNYIDGWFNGLGTGQQDGFNRYAGSFNDFHGNLILNAQDEVFEPEGVQYETRFWMNGAKDCSNLFGFADVCVGNVYCFRNWAWRIGNWISRPPQAAALAAGDDHEPASVISKTGQDSTPVRGTVHLYHNTVQTNAGPTNLGNKVQGVKGISRSAGGSARQSCLFILKNNIWRVSGYVHNIEPHPATNGTPIASPANTRATIKTDYNVYVSSATANGVTTPAIVQLQGATNAGADGGSGNGDVATIAAWRTFFAPNADTEDAQHDNLIGATSIAFDDETTVDGWFNNTTTGDLRLKTATASAVLDSGVVVPNVSDVYTSTAPARGYKEAGV